MPPNFRIALLIVAGTFGATPGHAQQMAGWPDWLREAMSAEAPDLATSSVEIDEGRFRFTLPGEDLAPSAFDGGWYVATRIGPADLECYVFTGDTDLANLVDNLTELNIEATAETNSGKVDNREIFLLDAGHLGDAPYMAIEWAYTVGEESEALVGLTKVRAASNGGITQACAHNTIGYRETFEQVFATFVLSTQQPAPALPPYYEEIIVQKLAAQPVGIGYARFLRDEDGDTEIYRSQSSLLPLGPGALTSTDGVYLSWSTSDGRLINANSASVENGQLVSLLSLERNADDDWLASGTFQGQEIDQIFDGDAEPLSELGQTQLIRKLFAGKNERATFPVWLDSDPTQLIQATVVRNDTETDGQAHLTVGPVSVDARFNPRGEMLQATMQIGAATVTQERIWHRGELR